MGASPPSHDSPTEPAPEPTVVFSWSSASTASFAAELNDVARTGGRNDVAVIADDCNPPAGWVDRLQVAARVDDTIAAASSTVAGVSAAAADARLYPRIFALRPSCCLVRREAIDLLGGFDESFTDPSTVLADFAARAAAAGLSCVLADDVTVRATPLDEAEAPQREIAALTQRHPWLDAAREEQSALDPGPLRRSLAAARLRSEPLSVTVDARSLGSAPGGTQTYVGALVLALARSGLVSVRALVANPQQDVVTAFRLAGAEVVTYDEAVAGIARTDVVHRPQQVFTPDDVALLRLIGDRIVITQLDLIGYRNATYHVSTDAWRVFRRTTRTALAVADHVVFLSDHSRLDALAEDLVDPGRTTVAGIGVTSDEVSLPARRPYQVPPDVPLLVMIGADYAHKNRPFALRTVAELRRSHGWDGLLVFAGAHVEHGSSAAAEAAVLASDPELAARVIDLGPVQEPEKRWLLNHAQATFCVSTYEGFGLSPLEAAAAGVPCIYASCTALRESAGAAAATVVPWDAAATASAAAALLTAGAARERHLEHLSGALEQADWSLNAERICDAYRKAVHSPYRAAAPRAWAELEREQLIVGLDNSHRAELARANELDANLHELRERLAPALLLFDSRALTPGQRRGLERVAAHPWPRALLLGTLRLLGCKRAKQS